MRMPVLFVGHGTPMNAIEDNTFTDTWVRLGETIRDTFDPRALVVISAHWEAEAHFVTGDEQPRQIYDMYGFPRALYELRYDAQADPRLARRIHELSGAHLDSRWGIDHGSWSVLCRMFPEADLPVLQISIRRDAAYEAMAELGELLSPLREEGVVLIGSGNVVHNLRTVRWDMEGGYDHCVRFDRTIRDAVLARNRRVLYSPPLEADKIHRSFITREHYAPLLYALGATDADDRISVFNEGVHMGSLSMTSYLFSDQM